MLCFAVRVRSAIRLCCMVSPINYFLADLLRARLGFGEVVHVGEGIAEFGDDGHVGPALRQMFCV